MEATITLGTLGSESTLLTAIIANSNENGVRIKRMKLHCSFSGKTAAEGPIVVGLANDLSATEIAEAMTAVATGLNTEALNEQANRPVYPLWVMDINSTGNIVQTAVLDHVIPEVDDFPRMILEGKQLSLFAHNEFGSALTTGTVIRVSGVIIGTWLRD